MGIWDDVDYRECERCGQTRHVTSMSCKGPFSVWICMACAEARSKALDELAAMGQEFDAEIDRLDRQEASDE